MQDAARRRAAQRYARWAERPTEARAVRYLDAAFGSAGESARFREVLAWLEDLGPTFSAGYVELLRQALRAAGGQEGADGAPSGAEPFPDPRSLVEALAVIADDDLESPPEDSDPDRCVIRAIVTGRIDAARDLSERLGASRLSAALRCHVLYLDGRIDEAILRLRALLEEASADADRDTFLIASHGLALIERHWGDPAASHSILSAALSVGQPGVVSSTFFGAMLHWAAVDAHDRGRYALRDALWRDGSSYAPGVGPLYGMGGDLVRAMVEEDPERFDRAAAEVIRARVERGYVIAALHTGVGALQRHAGPELFAAIAGIPAPRGSSPLSFLQPLAGALEAGRADEAGRILAALPAGFAPTSARMVAAAVRWWRGAARTGARRSSRGCWAPRATPPRRRSRACPGARRRSGCWRACSPTPRSRSAWG
ncbi:hypothetical protein [Rothia santali]|nr:hypothetical protein [Rothia santali]